MAEIGQDFEFDLIILNAVEQRFPELLQALGEDAHIWIRAQIWQESRFDRFAKSKAGALGLMQLMQTTAFGMGVENLYDPKDNIFGGVKYLAIQWHHLDEATDPLERIRWALASYNGGRGYVNQAMVLAREAEGLPGSHKGWRDAGRPAGKFQTWGFLKGFLSDPRCIVDGHHPDYHQMRDYVAKIETRYLFYRSQT